MIVYYRMCSLKSSNSKPSPIYQDDPFMLHRVCLESFVAAFSGIAPKMVFICDYCDTSYTKMIEDVVPFEIDIQHTALGINGTCLLQYKLFQDSNEDIVLFQEYDYFWKPNTGSEIIKALEELDFITPYDHPDKYATETSPAVKVVNNRHWKNTISTTATFATVRPVFEKHQETLEKHGYIDHARWVEIAQDGGKLWSPIPGIATHMVAEYISPHVDWGY